MIEVAVQGFLLGLATGHICLATCGPIYLPMLLIKGGSIKDGLFLLIQITAGRFITYALFGILAGFSGTLLPDSVRTIMAGVSYLVITVMLVYTVFAKSKEGCATGCGVKKQAIANPFLMGAVMGLSLCPSFLLALIRAVDLSGPLSGLILFSAFFVSTTLFILPLSIIGEIGRSDFFQRGARVAASGVALWCLVQAWPYVQKSYDMVTFNSRTITIMDNKPLLLIGFQGNEKDILAKVMASYRQGPVRFATVVDSIKSGLIICDGPLYEKHKDLIENLKKQDCCIVVMDRKVDEIIDNATVDKMATFLSDVRFLKRKGSGFIYHLSLSSVNKKV